MVVEAIDINEWYREEENKRKPKPKISDATKIQWMQEKYGNYWIGPAGVRIPWTIGSVINIDKCNICVYTIYDDHTYDISSSEAYCDPSYHFTIDQYRNEFAKQENDGNWYWLDVETDDDDKLFYA